jgi:hypothetical protein
MKVAQAITHPDRNQEALASILSLDIEHFDRDCPFSNSAYSLQQLIGAAT